MITIMLTLIGAALGLGVAAWRRLPPQPVLLLVGLLLSGWGWFQADELLQSNLLLGLTFLMFVVGAELDPLRIGEQLKGAVLVGLAQFFGLSFAGWLIAAALGVGWHASLYVGLTLAASSTLLVVTLLKQRQQLFEPFGRLVLGALLVQDVLVVFLLPIITTLTEGPLGIALALLRTGTLIGVTGICLRWLIPPLLLKTGLDEESKLLVMLAVLFAFLGLAYALDIPLVLGAFLGGVAMSRFPVRGEVRGQASSLADFFIAIFFVSLGASVQLPSLVGVAFDAVLLLTVLLLTPIIILLVARQLRITTRSALETALLLAQCGEFSLVVMLVGVERGHVGQDLLATTTLLVVVSMMLTPLLSTDHRAWQIIRWLSAHPTDRLESLPSGHVLLLGCGRHSRQLLERMRADGESVVVVDNDPGVIEALRADGVMALKGDGAMQQTLDRAAAGEARIIVSTMRRLYDQTQLLRQVKGPHILVRVFSPEDGAVIRGLGGTPIVESEAASRQFMAWYEEVGCKLPARHGTSPPQQLEPI